MTNYSKNELRDMVREGLSFAEIRQLVDCSDATIRKYIKCYRSEPNE